MRREVKLTAEIGGKRYACVPSETCSGCAFEPECGGNHELDTPMVEGADGLISPCVEFGIRYEELPSSFASFNADGLVYTGDTGPEVTGWSSETENAVLFHTKDSAQRHLESRPKTFERSTVKEV